MLLNAGTKILDEYTLHVFEVSGTGRHVINIFMVGIFATFFFSWLEGLSSLNCVFGGRGYHSSMDCRTQWVYVIISGAGLFQITINTITCMGMLVGVTGVLYGAIIVHGLATCWVERYSTLRKIQPQVVTKQGSKSLATQNTVQIDENSSVRACFLVDTIKTDAYEHYLLLREFVMQASSLWSTSLLMVFLVALTLLVIVGLSITYHHESGIIVELALFGGFFLFLAVFPIYCLAFANGAVYTIRDSLKHCSCPDDFKVIGGRDEWIAYLDDSPAYWTVFGVAVTWSMLNVYLSSIGTFAVVALGYYSNRSGSVPE